MNFKNIKLCNYVTRLDGNCSGKIVKDFVLKSDKGNIYRILFLVSVTNTDTVELAIEQEHTYYNGYYDDYFEVYYSVLDFFYETTPIHFDIPYYINGVAGVRATDERKTNEEADDDEFHFTEISKEELKSLLSILFKRELATIIYETVVEK